MIKGVHDEAHLDTIRSNRLMILIDYNASEYAVGNSNSKHYAFFKMCIAQNKHAVRFNLIGLKTAMGSK
jgi:hypothetical protein